MYAYGRGVPKDYVQAYLLYSLAAAAGDEDAARERESAAQQMTPEQIADAERLVNEWREKHKQQ